MRTLLVVCLLAVVPVSGSAAAMAHCRVPKLSEAKRAAGAREAHRYMRQRRREFRHDLMGYRRGPKLPPPSRRERRRITDERGARLMFALNPSRLLIRRLLRDHSRAVENSYDELGIALTPLEIRTVRFEYRFQDATGLIDTYAERCARKDDGGAYFSYRRGRGQLFVVNVTRRVDHYLDAYQLRFRYGPLLRVRRVQFSLRALSHAQAKLNRDWDNGRLARDHIDVVSTGIDEERNAVVVDLSNPSRRTARILRRRYGQAVYMDPHPQRAPVGGPSSARTAR
jgi:DNA-binding transcriptional ArsR family regulator